MMMKCLTLALVLGTCSSLKISPFVPREITKREVDIARTQFQLHRGDHSASELGNADSDQTATTDPNSEIVTGCNQIQLLTIALVLVLYWLYSVQHCIGCILFNIICADVECFQVTRTTQSR